MRVKKPIVFRIEDAQRAELEDVAARASAVPLRWGTLERAKGEARGYTRPRKITQSEIVRAALEIGLAALGKRFPKVKAADPDELPRSRRITASSRR
jgi:hypothetical protein